MATIDVFNRIGEKVSQLDVADTIFSAAIKEHLLWEVVTAQLAGRRSGTASCKRRREVQGSTRKIYRQKGTGRARHGSIRASTMVGGGKAFGPKPRSYEQSTNKKVRRHALRSALSLRVGQNKLIAMQDLRFEEIKTKTISQLLGKLGVHRGLIVDDKTNEPLVKSVRNLRNAKFIAPEGLNVYDILHHETLVMTVPAIKRIEERLLP